MYEPVHFVERRTEVLHGLIRRFPLGLLVSSTQDGPVADLVPFLLDADTAPAGRLRAHVARANPHWQILAANPLQPVLVVFRGPDAYVTPSWYETKRQTAKVVPTWNYVMVQVSGRAVVHDHSGWVGGQIDELTARHEASRSHPWAVQDAPEPFIEAHKRAIVGLEIVIDSIAGKWKVSQNRPAADQIGVVDGLSQENNAAADAMAELVRTFGLPQTDR